MNSFEVKAVPLSDIYTCGITPTSLQTFSNACLAIKVS